MRARKFTSWTWPYTTQCQWTSGATEPLGYPRRPRQTPRLRWGREKELALHQTGPVRIQPPRKHVKFEFPCFFESYPIHTRPNRWWRDPLREYISMV
jgi:hypothetical protein